MVGFEGGFGLGWVGWWVLRVVSFLRVANVWRGGFWRLVHTVVVVVECFAFTR